MYLGSTVYLSGYQRWSSAKDFAIVPRIIRSLAAIVEASATRAELSVRRLERDLSRVRIKASACLDWAVCISLGRGFAD